MTREELDAKLSELDIDLPEAPAPAANYVPYVLAGSMLHVSGQLPMADGKVTQFGLLGRDCDLADGVAAAKLCAVNLLAQVKAAAGGDLSRVERVVRLGGFVAATADFEQHPAVINGASDLMAELFGPEIGSHARAAVGVASLPFGASVEVDGIFLLRG